MDVCSIEEINLEPKQRVMARTGLAVAIPPGFYGRVAPRSGLAAKNGLDVLAGVIDSDYRGEVCCLLYNTGDETINLALSNATGGATIGQRTVATVTIVANEAPIVLNEISIEV